MKDWTQIRERYMRDNLPVGLGRLAANESSQAVVASLIDESKMFIEWTAAQAEVNTAAKLVELQVQLALWQLQWKVIWPDPSKRKQVAEQSARWSQQILELAGLLNR